MLRFPSFLIVLLGAAVATAAGAQDVEMLGRRYGTEPPAGYWARMRADRSSFQFCRSWSGSRLDVRSFEPARGRRNSGPSLGLGPRSGTVQGDFTIPVVLGLFSNSSPRPLFLRPTIQDSYFGSAPLTISDYYDEVSGGQVSLGADVLDWVQVSRPDTAYTVDESGIPFPHPALGGGGAGNFVVDALNLQVGVDWGRQDNDGADGVPNSGDDDGYVDVLAVIHPTRGGECGGYGRADRIWSHRWSLSSAVGAPFVTGTPVFGGGGGTILIDDYTIQPVIACLGGGLNPIGVFAHELGHAFGLPDLYDTCDDSTCPEDAFQHNGVGVWDLMSSGSWQCNNISLPASGAVTFEMAVPVISIERMAQPLLLSGPPLLPPELEFLDFQGNGTGGYDIGDFRAWLLANPRLPLSANFLSQDMPSTIIIPMRPTPASRLREERR